jgi:hypothetical protein
MKIEETVPLDLFGFYLDGVNIDILTGEVKYQSFFIFNTSILN